MRSALRRPARNAPLLIALVAACAAGCSWGHGEELVGKWRADDGSEIIEFMEDGSFLQSDSGGPLMGGRYKRVSDDTIRVSFGGPATYAPPRNYRVVRDQNALEITDPDGKARRYARAE